MSKILHHGQAVSLSLSLSGTASGVSRHKPDCRIELTPEFNLPASSTDFQDPKKRQQRRVPPASKAPGSIGRRARGKPFGGSSVDRMEMGGALDAVLAQDSVEEQERCWDLQHAVWSG